MRSNQDKIAQICEIHFMPISEAEIDDYPGQSTISISGDWAKLQFSKAEFKEEQSGSGKMVKQEFSATITGLNQAEESIFRKATSELCLLRIRYSNDVARVIGNEQVPVKLSLEISGSPSTYTLTCKRSSPEPSKFFKSF